MKLKSYMELKEWMGKNTPLTSSGISKVLDKIREIDEKRYMELEDWMEKNTPLTDFGIYGVLDKIQEIG